MSFDVAEMIKNVRAVEEEIDRQRAELEVKLADHRKFVELGRAHLLAFLNQTGQKSLNTPYGGCHWKPKISWRVEDKDAFLRHVLGTEDYGLTTWAAAPTNCNEFMEQHKMAPPGLVRSAVNLLYVTAPTPPKGGKVAKDS